MVRAWDVWRGHCEATRDEDKEAVTKTEEVIANNDEEEKTAAPQGEREGREEQEPPSKSPEAKRDEPQAGRGARNVALEVFCGYAGLSQKLQRAGFEVLPVDWGGNRHKPVIAIVRVDLTSPAGQELLQNQLKSGKVAFAWFAPPCGTFSRAREKPIPAHLRKQGAPEPQPLRDERHPLGFPWLQGDDRIKVAKGNQLARLAGEWAGRFAEAGAAIAIENPKRSWIWKHPAMLDLASCNGVFEVVFQHCMHGGPARQVNEAPDKPQRRQGVGDPL